MNIPPPQTGYRRNIGVVSKLKKLNVGEHCEFSINSWGTLHSCAKLIGIKIATRSLGNKKKVKVWRTE